MLVHVLRSRLEAGNRPRNEVVQLSKPVNIKPKSIQESEVCMSLAMSICVSVCVCVCVVGMCMYLHICWCCRFVLAKF